MNVSIGVITHNEENIIRAVLNSLSNQYTEKIRIKEIIAVSSGSTDKTEKIIKDFNVKLITQKKRLGKASAINEFLKNVKSDVLVMVSGDVIPEKDAVERLCLPLKDKRIGIVGCHPKPKNISSIIGRVVDLQWRLHHKISLEKPKFGEMIAFRKVFDMINDTAVDEEFIAMLLKNTGLRGAYVSNAYVYNKGPDNISDFLKQRRRIFSGHLTLKKKQRYDVPTVNNLYVLKKFIETVRFNDIDIAFSAFMLEALGRTLGYYDYYTRKDHVVWDIAKSTKK